MYDEHLVSDAVCTYILAHAYAAKFLIRDPPPSQFSSSRSEMFKVVFLGDSNVGKTCLARMLADRRTLEQSTATIGFDYHTIEIKVDGGTHATVSLYASPVDYQLVYTRAAFRDVCVSHLGVLKRIL